MRGWGGKTTKSWWPAVPVDRNRVGPSSTRAAGSRWMGAWWWRPVIDGQSSGSGLSRADHRTNREASKAAVQKVDPFPPYFLAGCCLSLLSLYHPLLNCHVAFHRLAVEMSELSAFSLSELLSYIASASLVVTVGQPCDQILGWVNLDRPCWLEDFCVSWFVFCFVVFCFFFPIKLILKIFYTLLMISPWTRRKLMFLWRVKAKPWGGGNY